MDVSVRWNSSSSPVFFERPSLRLDVPELARRFFESFALTGRWRKPRLLNELALNR